MNLLVRAASSLVLIPLLGALIFWAPTWAFALAVLVVTLLCVHEWFSMHGRGLREMSAAFFLCFLLAATIHGAGEFMEYVLMPYLAVALLVLGVQNVLLKREPADRLALVGNNGQMARAEELMKAISSEPMFEI